MAMVLLGSKMSKRLYKNDILCYDLDVVEVRMRKLLFIMLLLTGCSSASTRTSQYCDTNWSGRYNSWQECYDHQLPEHKSLLGAIFTGAGNGMMNAQKNTVNCTTFGNQTTCR